MTNDRLAQLIAEEAPLAPAAGALAISTAQRRELKAEAHSLSPVVTIADNGLSPSVLKEIDHSLNIHGLIKIRVVSDERELRETYLRDICAALGAAAVQHIGKLLVVWRPKLEKAPTDKSGRATGRRKPPRQLKRNFQNN
ncbi:MAG: YhbY family RNA-binding protein [Fluviibacter sp.]|jgi:putative YhbY family RNA-binding protein